MTTLVHDVDRSSQHYQKLVGDNIAVRHAVKRQYAVSSLKGPMTAHLCTPELISYLRDVETQIIICTYVPANEGLLSGDWSQQCEMQALMSFTGVSGPVIASRSGR